MKTIAQQLNIKDFPFEIKDKNGNQIYYENSEYDIIIGYWVKKEYDSQGNKIYSETSNGDWMKWKFDSQGNEIYYENSNGDWRKNKFDSQGNETYYENSDGNRIYYETINGIKYQKMSQ